jgi:hypothetical protein
VTTGDSVGSSAVSSPPWRKRLQLRATRTKIPQSEVPAHVRQHLQREVVQGETSGCRRQRIGFTSTQLPSAVRVSGCNSTLIPPRPKYTGEYKTTPVD